MRALQIPETHQAQIRWLEAEMLGTQFLHLVAELEAVHGRNNDSLHLDDAKLEQVRESGLSVLSQTEIKNLLTHPKQLLSLQQDVLVNGGAFWSEIKPQQLAEVSVDISANINSEPLALGKKNESTPLATRFGWALTGALAAAAAVVLLLRPDVFGIQNRQNQPVANKNQEAIISPNETWGFAKFADEFNRSKPSLDPTLNRKAYLSQLADAAKAWSNKRPATARDLAKRLGEFRMGCSEIILASHEPISEADRIWLRTRCRDWAAALDRHLADIEAGKSVKEVVGSVDITVTKIAAALLGRAATPQGTAS